ncbi:ABC-three component system middle component 6 [Actinoalloteichus hymeniacidonis]|uniref:ABC-three component system middle component 6 n=1 Tax=Actinoalloteichus hymeniacidonis TaxID=340345 RepID=UPI0035D3E3E1
MPTRDIPPDRCLLAVGAQILLQLSEPCSVSRVWSRLTAWRAENDHRSSVPFGWFVLGLDMLYCLGVVELDQGVLIVRNVPPTPAMPC